MTTNRKTADQKIRVLHVAPLLSADGSYGGPVSVAEDACAALAARGVSVTLLTGWDERCALPESTFRMIAKPARCIVPRRFATLYSFAAIWWFLRNMSSFDAIHIHLARDLYTMPVAMIARLARARVILQCHGMIKPKRQMAARMFDRVITRGIFASASGILVLTRTEAQDVKSIARMAHIIGIHNSAPKSANRASWSAEAPKIIFLSRLHERKRPGLFVDAARIVAAIRQDVQFEIWGPDEGELGNVLDRIKAYSLESTCKYRGSVPRARSLQVMETAQIFVLPSYGEVFPVSVLEAFAVGLPVVLTEESGISTVASENGAARVVRGDAPEIANAIIEVIASEAAWTKFSQAALYLASSSFSSEKLADELLRTYNRTAA